jgi:hypothetical protein
VGAETVRDESCRSCVAADVEIAAGYASAVPGLPGVTLFAMAEAEALASDELLDDHVRFGVGPQGGLHARLGSRVALLGTASWHHLVDYEPDRTYEARAVARVHLARNLSLALEGSHTPRAWEGGAGFYLFF